MNKILNYNTIYRMMIKLALTNEEFLHYLIKHDVKYTDILINDNDTLGVILDFIINFYQQYSKQPSLITVRTSIKNLRLISRHHETELLDGLEHLTLPNIEEIMPDITNVLNVAYGKHKTLDNVDVLNSNKIVDEYSIFSNDLNEEDQETEDMRKYDFPDVYDNIAGEYADILNNYMPYVPKQFFFMAYLTMFGCCIAEMRKFNPILKIEPRLYSVLVGRSGVVKKSTVMGITKDFFKDCINDYSHIRLVENMSSGEAVGTILSHSSSVIWFMDELKSFTQKANIQSSSLLDVCGSLYDKTSYHHATKKEETYVDNAHLSILALTTDDTYREIWKNVFSNIGFDNRLTITYGDGGVSSINNNMDQVVRELESLKSRTINLLNNQYSRGPIYVEMLSAAETRHNDYMKQKGSCDDKEYINRIDVLMIKMAMLFCIMRGGTYIEPVDVEQAIKIAEYQLYLRKYVLPIPHNNITAEFEDEILRHMKRKINKKIRKTITGSELQGYLKTMIKSNGLMFFKNALKNLIDMGCIVEVRKGAYKIM